MIHRQVDHSVQETYDDGDSLPCPYCGHPVRDLWDYSMKGDEDTTELECQVCLKFFRVTMHLSVSYTGQALKPST